MTRTLHQPSQGAKYSLYYITLGALVMIWSGIWYYYMWDNESARSTGNWYICTGLFLSGLAVFIIGILVGRIGKEAKNADVPTGTVTAATATTAPAAMPFSQQFRSR